jgi:hypothetical protein
VIWAGAALEVIRNYPLAEQERALLLSDDRDIGRVVVIDPDRLILLTTWDYLRQLEEARRIQSADAVIEAVKPRRPAEARLRPATRRVGRGKRRRCSAAPRARREAGGRSSVDQAFGHPRRRAAASRTMRMSLYR